MPCSFTRPTVHHRIHRARFGSLGRPHRAAPFGEHGQPALWATCPPTRPAFDPDWERRRRRSASGTRGDGDPANPTLLPVEVNALAIEEFHDDATMRSWPVKRLMEELKQARRNAPADKSILDGPMPLEKEELVAALRFARGGDTGRHCNICLSDYEEGDAYRVLPCGHRFHIECVDKWLRSTSLRCPLCNHDTRERWGS